MYLNVNMCLDPIINSKRLKCMLLVKHILTSFLNSDAFLIWHLNLVRNLPHFLRKKGNISAKSKGMLSDFLGYRSFTNVLI